MANAWGNVDLVGAQRTGAQPELPAANVAEVNTASLAALSSTAPDSVVALRDSMVYGVGQLTAARDAVIATRAALLDKNATLVERLRFLGVVAGVKL